MKTPTMLSRLFRRTPPVTTHTVDVAALQVQLHTAKCAHLAAARRISAFSLDHPELYQLYFTKAGDKRRKAVVCEAA